MYLLDTNVVSELRKSRRGLADAGVVRWANGINTAQLHVSVIAIQELETGVLLAERRDPAQGAVLRQWLNQQVLTAFEGRMLPVTLAVAQRAAALDVPNPKPVRDGLMAATALVHGLVVVTRNVQDFAHTGVRVLNPWG